ncbi:MAG: radical SAM protein, partial [Planctomycetes bacterium]|nr:radical SAM protein [Planctomycetota bacterium]
MKVGYCSDRAVLAACSLEGLEYQVDPYVGCEHYCYYCYVLNRAETDWLEEIRRYRDIVEQLRGELSGIERQKIYMGYYTDPYQPCEGKYRQTRKVLELLLEKGFSAGVLTKSDMVVRDADLLGQMDDASVSVSVAFTDDSVRRLFEANTIDTEKRIEALGALREAGVRTSALICPVIPYITDVVELIDRLAGKAEVIWIYGLSILDRSEKNWVNVERILGRHFPELKDRVVEIIFD